MSKISPSNSDSPEFLSHAARGSLVTEAGNVALNLFLKHRFVSPANSLAILCRLPENAVTIALGLEGFVRRLSILPWDEEPSRLQELLYRGGFEVIISDQETAISALVAAVGLPVIGLEKLTTCPRDDEVRVETEWLVPTSGTTSTPKLVRHVASSLAQAALSSSSVSGREVWGLLYDLSRFAGLQVLFQSVFRGKTLVSPPASWSLGNRLDFFVEHSVTHLSATPTLWRKILMTPQSSRLKLRQITLGGEAADQSVLSALQGKFPEARVTHLYASTEAGVVFWVSDGNAGFPSDFLNARPGRPELDIRHGRLFVRSIGAGSNYANGQPIQQAGWVDTGDLVEVKRDRLYIVGRQDQILNVGGDKVVVGVVRSVLLGCPEVRDIYVYGRPNPITGTLVACDAVLENGIDEQSGKNAIDSFAKRFLSRAERPRVIRFVDELKTNPTGKART